jgi:hypothetical protein
MATATLEKPDTQKAMFRYKVLAGVHVEGHYGPGDAAFDKGLKSTLDQKYYGPGQELSDIVVTHRNLLAHNKKGYPPKYALLQVGETGLCIQNPDGLDSFDETDLKKFAKANKIDLPVDATKEQMIVAIRAGTR